jgi:glyoxylase-like metal-dependent hydrolase (beta-lactamase superfamily II)
MMLQFMENQMASDWFEITPYPNRIFRISEPALGPLHGSHSWLVVGDQRALMIDTGVGVAPLAPVVRSLTNLPVICLISHSHYDHIGGAHEFADRRMHEAEAYIMVNPTPELTFWGGWLLAESFSRLPSPDYDFSRYQITPAPPTSFVKDGDEIDLGGRKLTLLHTPGHSPGLLSVFEAETRTLFSTDALYHGQMFFNLRGSNAADGQKSLNRLLAMDVETVHPGHYESMDRATFQKIAEEQLRKLKNAHL